MVKVHAFIEGRVQGVGFRYFAQREAWKLGITGWVKNTYDGRVEVLACGSDDKMKKFLESLSRGPSFAIVTDVKIVEKSEVSFCEFNEFSIEY
jgi:acylphosphatase